ncbi:MAG: beta-ketoacyl-[acyl-carrier-protein] synthase II [Spirochaetaceae bacterium]|nr:MAG: beta-ketoacyl-[acyl-carrier-protein] synthase II [Spirochaetaceae bacterium]
MSTKVVVTGLGTVSPLGLTVDETWVAATEGRSGIAPIAAFDPDEFGIKTRIAGEVKRFDPALFMDIKEVRRLDRFCHLTLAAAAEAIADAKLTIDPSNSWDVATIIATGVGGVTTLVDQAQVLRDGGARRVSPFTIPMLMSNAAAGVVSIRFGAQGPCFSVASACASSTDSIGISLDLIRSGRAKAVIAGGVDAAVVPIAIAGFEQARALCQDSFDEPERASRPFDATRSGFVLSEGAAVLILESEEFAVERGAHIICELAGYGSVADSYHITAPAPDARGAIRAMTTAIADAGLTIDEVGYINAHGTSTQLNDKMEALAIRTVFADRRTPVPVSSTKSMTGHLGGAAGALEAVFAAKTVATGIAPPTINYRQPDTDCDIDCIPNTARAIGTVAALSNSFGFGGHSACLAFKPWVADRSA